MTQWNTQHSPPPPPDTLWVDTVGAAQNKKYICYSNSVFGLWTHYKNGQTSPCYSNHEFCPNGHEENTLRWKGYLHCFSYERAEPVFLQLTSKAVWDFLQKIGAGIDLRGLVLHVQRTAKKNGRLIVSQDHHTHVNLASLPKVRDPRRSLEKLWKIVPIPAILNAKLLGGPDDVPQEALAG